MTTIEQLTGETEPNRIQGVGIETLSAAPLVGNVIIDTDFGVIRLAINRSLAEELRDEIERFLSTN